MSINTKKSKPLYIKVVKKYIVDPARPRPKWWDNFIGETFQVHPESNGIFHLTKSAVEKLSLLKGIKTYSAIIYEPYCQVISGKPKLSKAELQTSLDKIDALCMEAINVNPNWSTEKKVFTLVESYKGLQFHLKKMIAELDKSSV